MDIITLSSDSEASEHEYEVQSTDLPSKSTWSDEVYSVEWGTEDVYPSICYDSGSPNSKGTTQSNSEEIEDFITPNKVRKQFLQENNLNEEKETHNHSYEKTNSQQCDILTEKSFKKKSRLTSVDKEKAQISKEKTKLEKLKSKEEKKLDQLRQKALRAAFCENKKNLKPEENIKFLKVHIDNEIINGSCGGNIIALLQQNNIQYIVESQRKSCTISWSKRRVEKVVDDLGHLTEKIENIEENQLLYLLDWQKAVKLIQNIELLSHIETIRSAFVDKKLTVIIFGLEKYFNYRKKNNTKVTKSKIKETDRILEDSPFVSKDQLESAIIDLQLLGKHNCRFIETPEELSALVLNFTKSLSQVELKLEKQKGYEDLGWFAADSNQSVKVDKNGNGLLRLWQQQICQFNAVGLETAQAVVTHYKSPLALINHYAGCGSIEEQELLLQNIQIRRDAGIVSTTRRIGPQLSKKIYKFFTSDDPDVEL